MRFFQAVSTNSSVGTYHRIRLPYYNPVENVTKVLRSNALFATFVLLSSSSFAVLVQSLADRWQLNNKFLQLSIALEIDSIVIMNLWSFIEWNLAFMAIICLYSQYLEAYNPLLLSTKKATKTWLWDCGILVTLRVMWPLQSSNCKEIFFSKNWKF